MEVEVAQFAGVISNEDAERNEATISGRHFELSCWAQRSNVVRNLTEVSATGAANDRCNFSL